MQRRYVVWMGMALALALAATAVWAADGMRGPRPRARKGGDRVGMMAQRLGLSQDQVTKVKGIVQQEQPRIDQAQEALKAARQELQTATAGGRFDEAQVRAIAAKQAQALTDLIVERHRVTSRIYQEVLTPEQRAKADALHQRWQQGAMHRPWQQGRMHRRQMGCGCRPIQPG